jgi:methyl-accepting chemotaxis protein
MMFGKMTIAAKLILAGATAVILLVSVSAAGVFSAVNSADSIEAVNGVTTQVRHQMLADMMHDALRADVLMAFKIGPDGPVAEQDTVRADTAEHVEVFKTSVAELSRLDLSPQVTEELATIAPKLEIYLAAAQEIVETAFKDRSAAETGFQKFVAAFEDLEVELGKFGDLIQADGMAIGEGARTSNRTVLMALAILAVGSTLVILTFSALNVRSIIRPLNTMEYSMTKLAEGDVSAPIAALGRRDEIGTMAAAVQVFKENMIETERLRTEQDATKKRAEVDRKKTMLDLADKFEASVGGVVTTVTTAAEELQRTAQAMSATAEQTSHQSNAVASASEEMTQNVQTVASATEELAGSISKISGHVTESSRIVGGAVAQAEETTTKVRSLSEAAQKIGDVVTLINEIASQTNLLALNATIEAARAGEAGKGFAVVASEVKNLATQTAKATDEIAGQVKAIQESTDSSAKAIQGISQTINRVAEISSTVASAVEEQGVATQEISRNVQRATAGTSAVSSNITGVTQASQQTSAGATQVLSAASELSKNGAMLRTQVDEFLREIRAG